MIHISNERKRTLARRIVSFASAAAMLFTGVDAVVFDELYEGVRAFADSLAGDTLQEQIDAVDGSGTITLHKDYNESVFIRGATICTMMSRMT